MGVDLLHRISVELLQGALDNGYIRLRPLYKAGLLPSDTIGGSRQEAPDRKIELRAGSSVVVGHYNKEKGNLIVRGSKILDLYRSLGVKAGDHIRFESLDGRIWQLTKQS